MNTTIQTGVSAHITRKDVSFLSSQMKLAAHLYLPANIDSATPPLPAIVVGHPGTAVKEQTAGLYARLLALYRLHLAALSTTTLSIAEIAYSLGFGYPQSFNKFFKSKAKCSPMEYRQSFN